MQMDGVIRTSTGRDAEEIAVATQQAIRAGGVEKFATMTTQQRYSATNPFNPDEHAEGTVFELLVAGVPIGPAFVLLALGLNVGESVEAGPVKIERLTDLLVN